MNIFFCDLRGTYDGDIENRAKAIDRFVNNLRNICRILNIEEMLFDFITTDNMQTLITYIKEFEPYVENTQIKLDNQFSSDKKYYQGAIVENEHDNKLAKIYHITKNKGVKRIFYADDTISQQKMIRGVLEKKEPNIEVISIIPNNRLEFENAYVSNKYGIDGLNEAVETYIDTLENRHTL